MTGISCCCSSTLSARSNLATSWSVLGSHQVQTLKGSRLPRRNLVITAEVKFVNSEEAKKLIAVEGFAVLDVRDRIQFERAHIKDCYHIPLFIENKDNDLGTIIKRTLHNNFAGLFFGLPFTKANPEFVQSVRSQFSPESKLLLVCQEGLSHFQSIWDSTQDAKFDLLHFQDAMDYSPITPQPDQEDILTCRSASAAYKLEEAGYQNIACVTSGLQSVTTGTFDSVGSTELKDAGKAGLITIQGKISAVLGTVLICAFLFVTFFPDQAEKLFQLAPTS